MILGSSEAQDSQKSPTLSLMQDDSQDAEEDEMLRMAIAMSLQQEDDSL